MEEDFESKMKNAKEILDRLNDPEITLNKSMELYKQGTKILLEASKMLENAKLVFEEEEK